MTRRTTTICMTGSLILLAIVVEAVAAEPQPKPNDEATELKALQNERIEVLTQLVTLVREQYQRGLCQFNEVGAAQMELMAAQLDSTSEPQKRVALLTQQLEKASELLKVTRVRQEAGFGGMADVFRAKSLYLGVKVKLLRERSGQKPGMPAASQNTSKQ